MLDTIRAEGQPLEPRGIARALALHATTVSKRLFDMKRDGQVVHVDKTYWVADLPIPTPHSEKELSRAA